MKLNCFLCIFSLFTLSDFLYAQQVGFSDNFSDGNLNLNPKWTGDLHKFEVLNNKLHLKDTSKISPAYLSTPSQSINKATWEFRVQMDFAPSASNYSKVFLAADQQNLNSSLNGYFVKIGGQSGNVDDVSLYRMDGTSEIKIIDGEDGRVGINPQVYVKVTRDSVGNWELYTDTSISLNSLIKEGEVLDTTHSKSSYFGLQCIYTSTRSDLFYFDDIKVSGELPFDSTAPQLMSLTAQSDSSILLHFSEKLSAQHALNKNNYSINLGIGVPNKVDFKSQDSSQVELSFLNKFINGNDYILQIKNIEDIKGNTIKPIQKNFSYLFPELAGKEDIVINEVLFNPRVSGADFVELFNRSNKIISIQNWIIANESNGEIANRKLISSDELIIKPNDYLVITDDQSNILWEYPKAIKSKIIEMGSLPSFNNDYGHIYILNESEEVMDEFAYHEDMHFELLSSFDGVSLERVNPYLPSNHEGNFHSASETEGYATPTYQNSQYFIAQKFDGEVNVEPQIFSPDNDGFQDILNINYSFSSAGNVANVTIFDRNGKKVKSIASNELLGNKGSWFWDGMTDDFEKANIGIYIIYFETFNLKGAKQEFKKTCVVAGYLD